MSDNTSNVKKTQDFINSSINKIPFLMKFMSNIFTKILDKIVNGIMVKTITVKTTDINNKLQHTSSSYDHKYYRYFISLLLILILVLFNYLNSKQNLFAIKNTKYEALIEVMLIAFCIYCFFFFVYRNNTSWDTKQNTITNSNNYNSLSTYTNIYRSRSLFTHDKLTNKEMIDKDVLKKTLTKPLFNMMKYIFYLLLILLIPLFIVSYFFYIHKTDDTSFNVTKNVVLFLIIIIILSIIALIFSIKTSPESVYCIIPVSENTPPPYTTIIKNYVKYFACILKNLIFFIPCLLVIFVSELNKDIKLTPGPVYILFFILILLIILLFVLPIFFKYLRTFNKSDLLQGTGPFYLNIETTLGKYQNLNTNLSKNVPLPNAIVDNTEKPSEDKLDKLMDTFNVDKKQLASLYETGNFIKDKVNILAKDSSNNNSETKVYTYSLFKDVDSVYNIKSEYNNSLISKEKFPYNYTYSVSFYIYINPQPANTSIAYTKDTVLFNYAFKPVIYYNGKTQKIIVKSRTISNRGDQLDTIYEMSNPKLQKWLFFVINYDNNIIDVFIDGKLVGSKENVSPYFKGDTITIGEKDGIHGSIKEIYYYDKIKTPSTIELLYNLSKNNTN